MKKEQRDLIKYTLILPKTLEVEIHKAEEGGFWANIKNLEGCRTQGEDFIDLVIMINDVVFDYLEVPKKFRKFLGKYLPDVPEEVRRILIEKIGHKQTEDLVSDIIEGNKQTLEFKHGATLVQ